MGVALLHDSFQLLRSRAIREFADPTQQGAGFLRGQWLAQQKALRVLTRMLLQKQELRDVLDTLSGDIDLQRTRQCNDRRGDGSVITSVADAADKRAIYLEPVHRKVSQAAKAGVPGPEVIDGE